MADTRYFFIHVMKTAGATFRQHLRRNFTPAERYPNPELETVPPVDHNLLVDYLTGLPPARLRSLRCIAGHFPYVATEMLPFPVVSFTLIRDPVERVLSYLKQRRVELDAPSLEAVYDDEFTRRCLLDEHQTKVFAFTVDDHPESIMDPLAITDERFGRACANLERVEVVGLTERYDQFCHQVSERFGWTIADVPDRRVSEPVDVPDHLRDRIAAANPYDTALHHFAGQLVARRQTHR